jgi:uncharacterized protein YprB with RNaseH-like and TPR domain
MTLTLAKLQQLKRQAGGAATPAAPSPSAPRWERLPPQAPDVATPVAPVLAARTSIEQLRQLLRVRAPQRLETAAAHDRELPGRLLAPGLHLVEALLPDEPLPERFCGAFDRRAALDPSRLLFFDTETTGLAGGTGTRAFMIGAADWHEGALRVRQLLTTTMSAEASMLDCFAGWVDRDTTLVSYNGRCYDAPLLATRYRLARMRNPLEGLAHADLLFPVRRRFRGTWENCRLATVERRWLGVLREDDLPGSEAPRAWLDYLRGGDARDLRRVLEHNDQDVRTLGTLCLRLVALHAAEAPVALQADEAPETLHAGAQAPARVPG